MTDSEKPKRLLITGSRTWENTATIHGALRKAWIELGGTPDIILVTGACPTGADNIAENLWEAAGLPVERHPANWRPDPKRPFDRAAGYIRNQEMVDLGADICLAFWKGRSKGTAHTIAAAGKAGIRTIVFKE